MATEEKMKTMIGGQALIEGIMMRGPEKDAIVLRKEDGLDVQVSPRKIRKKGFATWPLIRGVVNFFDAQLTGVKAISASANLAEEEEEPSRFEKWLTRKMGSEKSSKMIFTILALVAICFSILIFFLVPMVIASFFDGVITSVLALNLIEGALRIGIFVLYMYLISKIPDMKRVYSYHGAEHKSIRCYEAKLPLTVENVRKQTRLHPRCGTSFLLVVVIISILLFSVASSGLLALFPKLALMHGSFVYRLIMIGFKLLLIPVVVGIAYEFNRVVGRHDNFFTRILTAPGMWFQHLTTNEPDDSMIEVAIAALNEVLPEQEGTDKW